MRFTSATMTIALSLGLAVTPLALAHGDDHGDAKTHTAVRKEQKPWGIAGDPSRAKRTIEIRMLDTMRFEPDTIAVTQGETVRLVLRNTGAVLHELVIGTRKDLEEHAALMARFPGMEHDEPYMAHVGPGKSGEIVWDFNRAGEFSFACLVAGHYQAGMTGKIKVAAPPRKGA